MLAKYRRLHFIGIGGIGVSAVARVALERGFDVSGSDVRQSQLTEMIADAGASVTIGHAPANLDGADAVVVSTAIPDHNVELLAARERGLPVVHRSELLAHLVDRPVSVGVTGTHGKGTVSSMIARILDEDGRQPGFVIGGILNDYGLNARAGAGDYMVAEIDESDGSHANVPTRYLVCNFLEPDHLNYYRDHAHIIEEMESVIRANDALEALFVNVDCEGNRALLDRLDGVEVVTYGVARDAAYRAELVDESQLPTRFEVSERGTALGAFEIPVPGLYNVENAVGAIAVARTLGVPASSAQRALAGFRGLENRFTIVQAGDITIVKDYNSHPTAMRKVLRSARALAGGKVYTVFKPYRYTLINYLKDEYATAFDGADEIVITTMYAANEDPIPGIDTQYVVDRLRDEGHRVVFVPDQSDIVGHLDTTVESGDKVIFFGGDDFFRMADDWAEARRRRQASSA